MLPWDVRYPPILPPALTFLPHQVFTDPDEAAACLSHVAPIRDFRCLTPRNEFYQRLAHLELDGAELLSCCSSDATFLVEDVPDVHLVVNVSGKRRVVTGGEVVECCSGGALLLPPGQRRPFGSHSAAVISLKPDAIASAAAAMAGPNRREAEKSAARVRHFAPRVIDPGEQAALLHSLIRWIDQCAASDLGLPTRLGAGDSLLRQVAALLDPTLLAEQPDEGERLRERDGRSAFDDLIAYIRANLDKPLRLSDLEARSHYSRRALHYTFRQKLGSSPMAWIRTQRLERAKERLQSSGPEVSVRSVALDCGYRNPGHFSSDFLRRFGVSPSGARRAEL